MVNNKWGVTVFNELTPLHLKEKFHLNIHIFHKDSNEKDIDNHENNISLGYEKLWQLLRPD